MFLCSTARLGQNFIYLGYFIGNLNQASLSQSSEANVTIRRGSRFDIGAFARAKKLAKDEASKVALNKSNELKSINDKCEQLDNEITAAKLKVY